MRFQLRTLLLVVALAAVLITAFAPKPKRYDYQCWEGGPHIVIPNAVAKYWKGGEGDPFADGSDYERACRIDDHWFGFIDVGAESALVLRSPPLAAWDRTSTRATHYFFVLDAWANNDLDLMLDRAKSAVTLQPTDQTWHVPTSGAGMIFACDNPAGDVAGRMDIPTLDGTYRISTGCYEVKGAGGSPVERVYVLRLDRIPDSEL